MSYTGDVLGAGVATVTVHAFRPLVLMVWLGTGSPLSPWVLY